MSANEVSTINVHVGKYLTIKFPIIYAFTDVMLRRIFERDCIHA